jgi:hypothetical protein
MKKGDIAMIILIATLSIMSAFFIANSIPMLQVSIKGEKVKTVGTVTSTVKQPDETIFNSTKINPTVETVIGGTTPTR